MGRKETILVNTRCLQRNLKGARRYLEGILSHLPSELGKIHPNRFVSGLSGQLWEQCVLPWHLQGRLLWSPTGTGPLTYDWQVLTIHDISPIEHPEWFTRRYASWIKFLIPKLAHRAKHIITISEYTKSRLVELLEVPSGKITVIHNGVSNVFTPHPDQEQRTVRKELDLPSGRYVLSLGTIGPRKNIRRLLEAWEYVRSEVDSDIWLVAVGEPGPAHRTLDLDIPQRVHFTGFVDDDKLPALYSGALLFAYPSLYEGFGLPPLEAMAAGTPPVVGDRTSLPEVVGDAGILVNPVDARDIAHGIVRLIDDQQLRTVLADRGIKRAKQFTWKHAARKTWNVLTTLAEA